MIDRVTRGVRRWSVAVLAAALLAACSVSKDIDVAQAAVAQFRELMAAQKFDQIYADASDELKKAKSEPEFTRLLSAVERKLGAVKNAQSNGWGVNWNPSGTTATLRFNTQFEKGTGAETFVYRIAGGKALLAQYTITSDDLIAN
jgi:hypothetical protein